MGSSQTRARTHVPCTGRRILNHCATRKATKQTFLIKKMSLAVRAARLGNPLLRNLSPHWPNLYVQYVISESHFLSLVRPKPLSVHLVILLPLYCCLWDDPASLVFTYSGNWQGNVKRLLTTPKTQSSTYVLAESPWQYQGEPNHVSGSAKVKRHQGQQQAQLLPTAQNVLVNWLSSTKLGLLTNKAGLQERKQK